MFNLQQETFNVIYTVLKYVYKIYFIHLDKYSDCQIVDGVNEVWIVHSPGVFFIYNYQYKQVDLLPRY